MEIGPAPGEIGDRLGRAQLSDEVARGRVDPQAPGRGHPDIAPLVAFHAVRPAGLGRRDDVGGEDAPVRERALRRDIENADQLPRRFVDVKKLLVGREAEAVRLIEEIVVDQELGAPPAPGTR